MQRIDRPRIGGSRSGNHGERLQAYGAVLLDSLAQFRSIHAESGIGSDLTYLATGESQQLHAFGVRRMRLVGNIGDAERALGLSQAQIARHSHRREVGHRPAGYEESSGGLRGYAELRHHPADHLAFDATGSGALQPASGVRIVAGREQFADPG